MEVSDVRFLSFMVGPCGVFRTSPLGGERILSPSLFPRLPGINAFKLSLHVGLSSYLLSSPIMSIRNDNMDTKPRDLCKVLWSIEADIADGQLLYVTGDPLSLGCWEPEMAILMSPSSEQSNLWKTEIKVPCGMNFKYNYFIKGDRRPSCDILWRQGPEFSLSIPLHCKQNEKIILRDLWLKNKVVEVPVPSWGSWIEDADHLLKNSVKQLGDEAHYPGERDSLRTFITDTLGLKATAPGRSNIEDSLTVKRETEETSSILRMEMNAPISERDQPCEEPWLLHSLLFNNFFVQNEETHEEFPTKDFQGIEVGHEEETKLSCVEQPISTVILINSSVCTMQRIAVLEDEKLVELLLEPVKNTVHCGSVYLGVVTKLVPNMGGAFVDIGISRPSLMDIKTSREPFAYPPFSRRTKKPKINGSVTAELKDYVGHGSHGEDDILDESLEVEFQDESEPLIHEELVGNEAEDGEISDTLMANVNSSLVEYDEGEVDVEDYFEEGVIHMEEETINEFLPLEVEHSNDSEFSQAMLKDSKVFNDTNKWAKVRKGTKVIVQVVKEGLGTKGPALTAYPCLKSRFWVLSTRCDRIGVSKKITGVERTRLRVIAKTLQPPGFGLTVRTVAANHSLEELQKDLDALLSAWKDIVEHAKSAALAADEGVDGAVPVILHRAMGQTLSVVQDYFNENVKSMVVDSPRTYYEVTTYLQDIAPDLCGRVKMYDKRIPIFDEYRIEEEINSILSKRVPLLNGGSLVIEQTEALVSIDVNGGHGMLGQGTSQEKAILDVNLAAAKQIARELRLRDIGGIIVVDFIDMVDDAHKRIIYEEMKKAVERDRSMVKVSELSRHGLMEITRKRVRPSVTFMISEPCTCCHATGRVEALETSFSKIEHEICRLLAISNQKADPKNAKSWPKFVLRVDRHMCNYLTSGKRTKLAVLSSSLKVWILLKVARGFSRGIFEVKPFMEDKANNGQSEVAISRLQTTKGGYIHSSKLTLFPVKKWKTEK
ncbi:ribonuclease E/G-like protein, chloroplastic [Aristolochia californica]|uniref:ribonuclease E/G-like protein, chloroplastic n=1 Tax=Aristolochia californica TaxID=171875 RepID=UPI0035DFF38E